MITHAPFHLVQQLLPILGSGSSVVLVSSLVAHATVGTLAAYVAIKGAIDTLVKRFAAALSARGLSCQRDRTGRDQHRHVEFRKDRRRRPHPEPPGSAAGGRTSRRAVAAFLASDAAGWITLVQSVIGDQVANAKLVLKFKRQEL